MSTPQYNYPAPPHGGSNIKTALAVGAIIASLGANGYLLYDVHNLREETLHTRTIIQGEIDTINENSSVMTSAQRKHMEELREDLDNRSRQLNQAASQAKREALTYADEKAKNLEQQQQKSAQMLSSSITDVKTAAETVNNRVTDVNKDVAGVKTELASTKTDLDATKMDLKKVSGDLGITSGFVATNGKEIEELRRRGERNIVEFALTKKDNLKRVGDISLKLQKADLKKNRFTVMVQADDKTTEKKDKTVNEPLQFYVSKSLYEVVVNSVGKDQIAGYLSTPKYQSR